MGGGGGGVGGGGGGGGGGEWTLQYLPKVIVSKRSFGIPWNSISKPGKIWLSEILINYINDGVVGNLRSASGCRRL